MPVDLKRQQVYHVLGDEKTMGQFSVGYYLTFDDAREASRGRGLDGEDGMIEKVDGMVVDQMYIYLEDADELLPLFHDDLSALKAQVKEEIGNLRRSARSKLSPQERLALGL